ncbi:MAG: phosphomethylpyrimidine kinase [Candidatus Aramenus sp.]|jgi:predicted fused transcriptional regulator/phosphomethylpyrimidine kinase|nr:phosphomethylpyrimidine kinase [Candidatus Aramenus sp.]
MESERDYVLKRLKEAADIFVSEPKAYLLVPEIRVNIGYAVSNATGVQDVAAIPGRITTAFNRAFYCMPPAFGASDHVARVILTAMKYDPQVRSAIDVKYYKEIVERLDDVYVFDRRLEPLESRSKEGHTMNLMVRLAHEKMGRIPKYIVDMGDYGKEPTIFVLGKDPVEVVRTSLSFVDLIQK